MQNHVRTVDKVLKMLLTRMYLRRRLLLVLSLSCLNLLSVNSSVADETRLNSSASDENHSGASTPLSPWKPQNTLQEVSLTVLQDVGTLLGFVEQQTCYIYQEASRVAANVKSDPDIKIIREIPCKLESQSFLPARQERLVFFLSTLEPIIRQMGKQVNGIESGTKYLVIPESLKKSFSPLWASWTKNIQILNKHLDALVVLFDDAPHNNKKIQVVAASIFQDVQRLDNIRKNVYHIIQKSNKKGKGDKVLISPM
jgi:hypothetical protein